jgi:hypothetical protein
METRWRGLTADFAGAVNVTRREKSVGLLTTTPRRSIQFFHSLSI